MIKIAFAFFVGRNVFSGWLLNEREEMLYVRDVDFRILRQLFNLRDLRNALMALSVVFGGLGLAFLTLWASQTGRTRLAGIGAAASLIFVLLIVIFVIPPLARSASSEASQWNLPFEFTAGGAVFFGLLVIVGFSAWNTSNNLLFLILAFMTSALIVGFILGNFALKKVDVKMRFPETIFAGQLTPILVSLNNRKRIFPAFSIIAEVRGKERECSAVADELAKILPAKWAEKLARPPIVKHTLEYFVHLPRRRETENRAEHIFKKRGRFIIQDFELSTRYPFGFFRHRRRLPAQKTEIFIFPKIEPLRTEIYDLPLEAGKLVALKRGAGQDLLSLRDYQPQDDLRHVDWKATARARRLMVREFAAEDDKRVTVVFDTRLRLSLKERTKTLRERMESERRGKKTSAAVKRFERGVREAASILAHFAEEQAEIRLVIDSETGEYGIGREHLNECLKRLAIVEPRYVDNINAEFPFENFAEVLDERERCYLFFVTTTKEEKLPPEIQQQARVVKI